MLSERKLVSVSLQSEIYSQSVNDINMALFRSEL